MARVNVFKVNYFPQRHKHPIETTDFVVAAAGTSPESLAATIKSEIGESKSLTLVSVEVIRTNVIQ